jgi:hypothetical protein
MGVIITFHTTKNKQPLGIFFKEKYTEFRHWCIYQAEFTGALAPETQDFLLENENLPAYPTMDREILDDMAVHFVNVYCGIIHQDLLETKTPLMKRDHYVEARMEIEKKCTEHTLEIWEYMLKGRTLYDGSVIAVSSNLYHRLGYWTVNEQIHLQKELKKAFNAAIPPPGVQFVLQVLNDALPEQSDLIILTS